MTPLWVHVDPVPTSSRLWPLVIPNIPRPRRPLPTPWPRCFRGPTCRLALTSGHQPTLRDAANHRSASAVGRRNKGAAWGTQGSSPRGETLPARSPVLPKLARPRGPNSGEGVLHPELSGVAFRREPAPSPRPCPQPGACRTAALPKHSMNF